MDKITSGLSGIAGEYFVAGELSRRGFMASITLRNNDSIDIHASRLSDKKLIAIQVKTKQTSGPKWPLNSKSETLFDENLFYIFVLLRGPTERPDYFIVPSKIVSLRAADSHKKWLDTPGKKGQPHNDSTMRMFEDKNHEFLERWDLLD